MELRSRVQQSFSGQCSRPVLLLALAFWVVCLAPMKVYAAQEGPVLHVFWSLDCPVCIRQKDWLDRLENRFDGLRVIEMELSESSRYHALFAEMAAERSIRPDHVPTLMLAGRAWVGDSPALRTEVEAAIEAALSGADPPLATSEALRLPLVGELDPVAAPALALTLLIAFVDGFNPCSLWVLMLLLGMVIASGSRRRVAVVGVSFLVTTALIYGAFIAGLFSVLAFAFALPWVRWAVALFALGFGLVSIKDYFWYGRGITFSIPAGQKPGMYQRMRRLRHENMSTPALIGATVVMASGIALVELPCTAGFPVVWSAILAERGIGGAVFVGLLAVYVIVYLAIELTIFAIAIIGMNLGRVGERHGRVLKMIGGAVMVALAGALALRPELMDDIAASSMLFGTAIALAAMVAWVHSLVEARLRR
jgi:hypothetical protein